MESGHAAQEASRQGNGMLQPQREYHDPGAHIQEETGAHPRKTSSVTIPASATSSPLSSTPNTPRLHNAQTFSSNPTSRRQSTQALQSPMHDRSGAATPIKSPHIRRASSSFNMRTSTPSPKLARKPSRSSLGGHEDTVNSDRRPTPKRSISNLITGLREAQAKMESIEEPKLLTAVDVASVHFARELATHGSKLDEGAFAETVVILHDACYGHRFSRPKTTKSHLSMIVERPERLNAAVLGAAAAYIWLGQHYAGGLNAPTHMANTAATPPFKVRRTSRELDITSSYVTNVHGSGWMHELRDMCALAGKKLAAGEKELSRASTPTQSEHEKHKLHEGDLYLCSESLAAFQGALGGVADAIDTVFAPSSRTKRAFVGIRPPGHHCSADHPSGFCWLNNVHVGIEYACQNYDLTHAVILDFDLHHGDGSQSITWSRNKANEEKRWDPKRLAKQRWNPNVGYYSLHDINSYPCEDGDDGKVQAASLCIDNAHGQSVWNVHLQPWRTEEEFWDLYNNKYSVIFDKARAFLRQQTQRVLSEGKKKPKAAVFISAGFDASEWEGAGMQRHKVNVPTEFYARFTLDCASLAQDIEAGCDGRMISVLEGGYSDRALCSGVLSHLAGLCSVSTSSGSGAVGSQDEPRDAIELAMKGLSLSGVPPSVSSSTFTTPQWTYDKSWWSQANLTALETQVLPPPPVPAGKKARVGLQPTYATPTESFAYKVRDTDKFARSISGTLRESPAYARPLTPPPPEVDWVIATQEFHKLLVPSDRSTKSCTAEELGGVRGKKEPQPSVTPSGVSGDSKPAAVGGRQLRERASKAPVRGPSRQATVTQSGDSASDVTFRERSVSRSDRRQTIADFTPADSAPPGVNGERRASRRLSAMSLATSSAEVEVPPLPQVPDGTEAHSMPPPPPPPRQLASVTNSNVQVKKTRPIIATPSRVKPGTTTAVNAPAPPARTTGLPGPMSAVTLQPVTNSAQKQVSVQPAATTPTEVGNNDVDSLAKGLKKVTLKVGTREESERRVKERQEAERKARALKGAETRRRNAEARKTGVSATSKPGMNGARIETGGEDAGMPPPTIFPAQTEPPTDAAATLPEWARVATNQLAEAVPQAPVAAPEVPPTVLHGHLPLDAQESISKLSPSQVSAQPTTNRPLSKGSVYSYVNVLPRQASTTTPAQQSASSAEEQPLHLPSSPPSITQPPAAMEQPLIQLPAVSQLPDSAARPLLHEDYLTHHVPNTEANGAMLINEESPLRPRSRGKEDLPVFSSTGFIPFGSATTPHPNTANAVTGSDSVAKANQDTVWDVPDTPR